MSFRILAIVLGLSLGALACSGPPACPAGTANCPCRSGAACDTGLTCGADGKCAGGSTSGVTVTDANARGCELLLNEPAGTAVVGVTFNNGLKGTWVRESPKVAVTFVAGADKAIGDGSVVLALTGGTSVSVTKASCVDVHGARVNGTPVVIK
jgi:hypothetical protein